MEDRASAVGQRVRYWRQRRNLDRKQLADMVGRSTSWLDKIEKGERSLLRLPTLERVAEVLSIDPSVLTDSEVAPQNRATARWRSHCTKRHWPPRVNSGLPTKDTTPSLAFPTSRSTAWPPSYASTRADEPYTTPSASTQL